MGKARSGRKLVLVVLMALLLCVALYCCGMAYAQTTVTITFSVVGLTGVLGVLIIVLVVRTKWSLVPLVCAGIIGFSIVSSLFGYVGERRKYALHLAMGRGDPNEVQLLIDRGYDVNMPDPYGIPPVMSVFSFYRGKLMVPATYHETTAEREARILRVLAILIKNGADVNVGGGYHYTPLARAINLGSLDAVKLLVENGANVNMVVSNDGNETPLDYATRHNVLEIVEYLRQYGAE